MGQGTTRWIVAGRMVRDAPDADPRFLVVASYRVVALRDDAIQVVIESGSRTVVGRTFWWVRSELQANIAFGDCRITDIKPEIASALAGEKGGTLPGSNDGTSKKKPRKGA